MIPGAVGCFVNSSDAERDERRREGHTAVRITAPEAPEGSRKQ